MKPTPAQPHDQDPPTMLFLLFCVMGVLIGLFLRDLVEEAGVSPRAAPASGSSSAASTIPAGTISVNVSLSFPTPAPSATRTPEPPATLGAVGLDFCGAVTRSEGDVCRLPLPTPLPTATFPTCWSPESKAGELCVLRNSTPSMTPNATPNATPGASGERIGD